MGNVKILTDSCAYLSPDEVDKLEITVVPLTIRIGSRIFKDGDPQTTEYFFEQQERGFVPTAVIPPSVKEFERAYARLHKETDQILALHVSGQLSDTLKRSQQGAESLRGRCSIESVDTNAILLGQGILVKAAAKAAKAGASMDEIIRLVRGLIPHIYTVLYVDAMTYLERSGKIGQAQAILGTMMQIKPLLFMEDGEIIPMEKVKTVEKAIDKLTEFVAEFDSLEQTVIIQRSLKPLAETKMLLERLSQLFPGETFLIIKYNPLLATYIGPSAMGIIVYEGETEF